MTPKQIAKDRFDYIDGLLSVSYYDNWQAPADKARRCVACIKLGQSLRKIPPVDPRDIFMAWMELKNDD